MRTLGGVRNQEVGEGLWQRLPSRETERILERAGHTETVVGKHVIIIGGRRGQAFYKDWIRLDTHLLRWDCGFPQLPFQARGYHSAVRCGTRVFVIGGSDHATIFSDTWVLDTVTLSWEAVNVRNGHLLQRTAHGCVVHPEQPNILVIFGGYGTSSMASNRRRSKGAAKDHDFLNDILHFDTDRLEVQPVRAGGIAPEPRGYHTFQTVGDCCYVIGGRGANHRPVPQEQFVACYHAGQSQWLPIREIKGLAPPPVSSLRGAALEDSIVLFGGANDQKERFNELWTLNISRRTQLKWSSAYEPPMDTDRPCGRAAHSVSVVGGHLYIISGYGSVNHYASDAWRLSLRASQAAATESQQGGAAGAECSQWMRAKRKRAEPMTVAANGQAPREGAACADPRTVKKVPALQTEPAPVLCQVEGHCQVAAVSALQKNGPSPEEERLRHENEELRRALDHERNLLKGMVDNTELMKQRMAAETAQRRLQSELQELRQATDIEMHALRRQHQIAEDRLQREVLARQAAEQELLHAKRAQESADEAARKARLYSSELAQKAEEARNESLLHMQSKEVADQELQRLQKEVAVMQRTCEHLRKEMHGSELKRKEAESLGEKLQTQLFQARDSADKERTQLVERAAKAEAFLTDAKAELERLKQNVSSAQNQLAERQAELQQIKEYLDAARKEIADMKAHASLAQQWLQMMPAHMKGHLGHLGPS